MDTLDIRPLPGVLLKHFTALDVRSRFTFARAYKTNFIDYLDEPSASNEKWWTTSSGIIPENRIAVLVTCHHCAIIQMTSAPLLKSPICYGRLHEIDCRTGKCYN
ncbi:hypothetical protein ACFLWO_01690 [Chloroflexota bacterium]